MTEFEGKTTSLRSKIMSNIHSTGTKPEVLLRKRLYHEGIRYRVNYKKLPGSPDIVITKYKIVVFVDGEFWHGYNWEKKRTRIKRNRNYWIQKIQKNINRDSQQNQELHQMGWTVLHFWSHDVLKNTDYVVQTILYYVRGMEEDPGGTEGSFFQSGITAI
ncbi:very short patch repair endonuclease [Lactobacillus helveticus]|uniref:very short patch repair endonuclease n=1 Tax=Lactobacillus helveticus TaxID=1587 RepID=UPI001562C5EC|nr:very short patch repair endonuclease [Lactobacillus helveticus]NRO87646.1 Very short patch repair protein [Lactobacillus helveticus]